MLSLGFKTSCSGCTAYRLESSQGSIPSLGFTRLGFRVHLCDLRCKSWGTGLGVLGV